MAHDMSDAVATRRKLEKLSDDLARQLKAAEAANEAKSQFLSVISHELRTPLNGVLGMAQLLTTTPLDGKQGVFVDTILHSGAALQRIIEDILDLTMMASGRINMDLETHDIRAMVERTVARVGAAHGASDRLLTRLDPQIDGASIVTDRDRLEQVLTNLIDNAIKFGEGKPITISAEPLDVGTGLRLEVRDEGVGIPLDKQEIIFHRFTQADQSATRSFGGAGLGLSICREIVTALGGEIRVDSTVGEGTTFRVELPGDPSALDRATPGDPVAAEEGVARDPVVVVVDDDPISASVVAEVARQMGREAVVYHDATKALRASPTWGPALVFTDLHMPGMSGEAFARALRASDATLAALVMMTADARETNARFTGMGVDVGLHKPLDLGVVRQIIADASARRSASDKAALG
jgi:nitrogen-specific signal transduction histidine kinase/CheY-like chemotaxis protein